MLCKDLKRLRTAEKAMFERGHAVVVSLITIGTNAVSEKLLARVNEWRVAVVGS